MQPIDFTTLGAVGILSLAILAVTWIISPLIKANANSRVELADINKSLLEHLKSNDKVIDNNTEVHKKTVTAMDATTSALRSLESEVRSSIGNIVNAQNAFVASQNAFTAEQAKTAQNLLKLGNEVEEMKKAIAEAVRPISRTELENKLNEIATGIKEHIQQFTPKLDTDTGEIVGLPK